MYQIAIRKPIWWSKSTIKRSPCPCFHRSNDTGRQRWIQSPCRHSTSAKSRLNAPLSNTNLTHESLHSGEQISSQNDSIESVLELKSAIKESVSRIERMQAVVEQETRHFQHRQSSVLDSTHDDEVIDTDEKSARLFLWGRPPGWSHTNSLLTPQKVDVLPGQSIVQIACGGNHILYLSHAGDVYSSDDHSVSSMETTDILKRLN